MGLYRNYKFRIREEEMSKGYIEILDSVINVLEKEGLLKDFIDESD